MPTSKEFPSEFQRNFFIFGFSLFRVLLRVRMLYYIKHEIIGDYVQQIQDGIPIRYRIFLPFFHSFLFSSRSWKFLPPPFRQINKHIHVSLVHMLLSFFFWDENKKQSHMH